jgi:hypothetical protein
MLTKEASIVEQLAGYPYIGTENYKKVESGDFNSVLLGDRLVVKTPHSDGVSARAASTFEAYVVAELDGCISPLAIPRLVTSNGQSSPYYVALTRVPGEVLHTDEVQLFCPAEMQSFGAQTGGFIAWLAANFNPGAYQEIVDLAGYKVPHRGDYIDKFASDPLALDRQDRAAAYVALDVYDEYKDLQISGAMQPSLIGHDDLRVDNMTFEFRDRQWHMAGVFDFNLTKPSTPEEQLRHIAPFGDWALEAAIKAYEEVATSARRVSLRLIGFWALAQAVTVYFNASRPEAKQIARDTMWHLVAARKSGYLASAS